MVAVATSMVGVIGFIGLVVPHLLRMLKTADNRYLIIGSSLLGASLLTIADMMARIIIAPAELPIGIITALIGAPVFIWMLTRQNKSGSQGGFYA
jgi:iron complex transport system permease protein